MGCMAAHTFSPGPGTIAEGPGGALLQQVAPVLICALVLALEPVGKTRKSVAFMVTGQERARQGFRRVLALTG